MKILIVLKKELLDQIRDRRTIIAALVMPAVIVPVLLFFLMQEPANNDLPAGVRIVTPGAAADTGGELTPGGETTLGDVLHSALGDFATISSDTPDEAVRKGEAELAIEESHGADGEPIFILRHDPARKLSGVVFARVHAALQGAYGAAVSPENASIRAVPVRSEVEYTTLLTLSLMLPVFLMVFSASTTMSSVIDMSAGEKERGTLETLLSSSVSRPSLLLGKILAAAIVGITAGAALLAGLAVSSAVVPEMTGGLALLSVAGPPALALILVVLLSCVLLFSATGMALGLYAKSVKEGTVFTLPVIILVSVLSGGMIAGDPFIRETVHLVIPVVNTGYSIRALLFGHADYPAIALAIVSTLCGAALMYGVSYLLLKREKVINRS